MITIDGSQGEGGGQVLRSALALSLVTGRGFLIRSIRARRKQPGLLPQHLAAVRAAAEVGHAEVTGASLGSSELRFEPGVVRAGECRFAVGTAGSATLVLQAVLPPLLCAEGPSTLWLEGGTHNPWAPPFDFLAKAFLPLIRRMGPTVAATLVRPGFFPAGGGELQVGIMPAARLSPVELLERGAVQRVTATACVAQLPRHIAERELQVIGRELRMEAGALVVEEIRNSRGPGNTVMIKVVCEHVTEVFTGFGQRGVRAEAVAEGVLQETQRYLAAGVPVGEHLADQLLLPLALTGGGTFRTLPLTGHAETNMDVIRTFLDVRFSVERDAAGCQVRLMV